MPLTLRPVLGSPSDQHVMHGEWQIGQIDKRPPLMGRELRWIWSLNGVPWGTPQEMRLAGVARSLDEAAAEVKKSFELWLAWAQLSEAGTTGHGLPLPSKPEGSVRPLEASAPKSGPTDTYDSVPGASNSEATDVKIMNILISSDTR
jgi:hypothetical protein